VWWYYFN